MTDYRHALIGCGRVAANHVDGFRRVPGWVLAAACDREPHVAEFARAHAIPRVTRDAGELFADPSVTSVSIAVDHRQHGPLVERALLAGKHVLVEKPLCLDPKEARDLVALADERSLVLSAVAQHRYDPLVLAVRDWVARGLLGDLVQASVALQARRTPEYYTDSYWRGTQDGEGGSALINQGYHCLDAVRWICGDLTATAALRRTRRLAGVIETEDTLGALLSASGVPVTLNVTVASSVEWRTRIEIVGVRGSVVFDLDHPGRLSHWEGPAELVRLAERENARGLAEEPPGASYYGTSHRRQIADFCRGVAGGGAMLSSAADAVGTLETIVSLYELSAG
ncbi:Gfo/Idh/MocA family protein [Streptacidiphilus sp. P02-A3a]|uniref:Gfo/Idh/MocA family protein n=1 Tax=Streptacidiphilus sp. P02-A3a TaxID=2704468 RepID=UPI0015FD1BCE|nr:Gfo/Idh/MocA family oxidoreductase [Streptacidiphilus sp. P02-A3a]QMU67395.1 Gfo/Idh/MocA family oxidoreductase [Streptacidiphilus sp. P02-A3a]